MSTEGPSTLLGAETIEEDPLVLLGQAERVVTLTVVGHPSASRVGDVAHLAGGGRKATVDVSRAEPDFRAPGSAGGSPLTTPLLSRKPLRLAVDAAGQVTLDPTATTTRVLLDGEALTAPRTLSLAEIDAGLVLELGRYVVLLLHRARRAPTTPVPTLGLVGHSDGLADAREMIRRVAPNALPVLVRGETGTGKELVAAALHDLGPRRGHAYVPVNMAALPPTLVSSELFGHVRGAFSGASQAHDGFFVRADGGTLFLDEIGDAPVEVQTTMLRALETGEVQAVGARQVRKVDVRLVAATDADLAAGVAAGRFRAPLYYRLAHQEIFLPPLRERPDDIGRLLVHFLRTALRELHREALLEPAPTDKQVWLSGPLVARLARHRWPGNVRELRNLARLLATLSDRPGPLHPDDPLIARHLEVPEPARAAVVPPVSSSPPPDPLPESPGPVRIADITDEALEEALEQADYRLGVAADALGLSRPSINRLVDRHPTLVRPVQLTEAQIDTARAEADAAGISLWRHLRVSDKGLRRRMVELGMD